MTGYYLYGEKRPLPGGDVYAAYLDPSSSAVVSIDMHQGHLSDSPACPCPAPRGRALVDPMDSFHDAARSAGARVIHVRTGLRPSGADDVNGIPSAWRLGFSEYVGGIPNIAQHGIEGTQWTRLVTRTEPDDEIVSTKKRLSAFYPTDLDFLLRQMRVETLVLTGIMTDVCILSTAFDASNRNYRVITVRDLVAGTNDELEDAALKIMSLNTGLVMDWSDLTAAWAEGRRRQPARTGRMPAVGAREAV